MTRQVDVMVEICRVCKSQAKQRPLEGMGQHVGESVGSKPPPLSSTKWPLEEAKLLQMATPTSNFN